MKKDPVHVVGASSSWRDGKSRNEAHCSCGWRLETPTFEEAFKAEADHLHAHGLQTREEQMAARDVVRLFSNGTEFRMWEARNCDRCLKRYDDEARDWRCPIERAIGESMWDEDGAMDREMAARGGMLKPGDGSTWECPEIERDWSRE